GQFSIGVSRPKGVTFQSALTARTVKRWRAAPSAVPAGTLARSHFLKTETIMRIDHAGSRRFWVQ
ncbi:hypothetical protein, partial [Salinisphaera hydrothermalis]|uniref:hypothetical protein n=1 Tax=Salinisphaera hydrothermalis TaxID=563188 RepID=UPI001E3AB7FF